MPTYNGFLRVLNMKRNGGYPLVFPNIAGWKIKMFNRKYILKGSIFQPAMLVYRNVFFLGLSFWNIRVGFFKLLGHPILLMKYPPEV